MRGLLGCLTLHHGGTLRPLAILPRVRRAPVRTRWHSCAHQGTGLPTLPGQSVVNCVQVILLSAKQLTEERRACIRWSIDQMQYMCMQ